jgi:transposase
VAWLAQRVGKTTITKLLRVRWAGSAVDSIAISIVAEQFTDARLDGLSRIGVDEVSYRKDSEASQLFPESPLWRVVSHLLQLIPRRQSSPLTNSPR